MEQAVKHIVESGLTQQEKDKIGGILLADNSLAVGINLFRSDALRELINQKSAVSPAVQGKQP